MAAADGVQEIVQRRVASSTRLDNTGFMGEKMMAFAQVESFAEPWIGSW
jgi:hypothetical protein